MLGDRVPEVVPEAKIREEDAMIGETLDQTDTGTGRARREPGISVASLADPRFV